MMGGREKAIFVSEIRDQVGYSAGGRSAAPKMEAGGREDTVQQCSRSSQGRVQTSQSPSPGHLRKGISVSGQVSKSSGKILCLLQRAVG